MLLLPMTGDSTSSENPPESRGERVSAHLIGLGTRFRGATKQVASGGTEATVGKPGSGCLAVSFFDEAGRPRPELLVTGVSDGDFKKEEWISQSPHVWCARWTPLASPIGRIGLDVEWEHISSEKQGVSRVVERSRETITLREGEHHVLGFLSVPAGLSEANSLQNLAIAIDADILEDPAAADTELLYDLWFSQSGPGGVNENRHANLRGKQGEEVRFKLDPLRWTLPGSSVDGAPIDAIAEIAGSIQGRVREDGTVDVALDGSRRLGGEPAGRPMTGSAGDGGRKIVSMRPGETVRLVLPALTNGTREVRSKTAVPGEVRANEDSSARTTSWGANSAKSATIDWKKFYAGREDSFTLTVTVGKRKE
jgi:hypothetical protein